MNRTGKKFRFAAVLLILCLSNLLAGESKGQQPLPELTETKHLVSNIWVDTPLSQVLRDISMQLHVTITLDPTVIDPFISMDVEGMPLAECLDRIAVGQGLVIRKINEGFYLVSNGLPGSPIFEHLAYIERVPLKYITANHLLETMPRDLRPYVSKGKRTTEVLVYAPPRKMSRILDIVNRIDVPRQQVVLEALVVEFEKTGNREFGIDWERAAPKSFLSLRSGTEVFDGIARFTTIPEQEFVSFLVTLRMLVNDGQASIRSRPRVATLNGEQATIDMSLEEYFTIVTDVNGGLLRTELQVIKSGVLLKMTPQIGYDGDITVNVSTEVSDVASRENNVNSGSGNSVAGTLPIIRRRRAETKVRVKEGDAIVIGGLIESQERSDVRRVPFFGSIPLLGHLFRKTVTSTMEKEVIIFITPRLLQEGSSPLANHHKCLDVEEQRADMCFETLPAPTDAYQ